MRLQARIIVKPRDRFSNAVTLQSPDPCQAGFQVDVLGASGPLAATWDLTACTHGDLAASYMPITAGPCSIAVKHQGQHVQASPYQVSSFCAVLCCAVLCCAVLCAVHAISIQAAFAAANLFVCLPVAQIMIEPETGNAHHSSMSQALFAFLNRLVFIQMHSPWCWSLLKLKTGLLSSLAWQVSQHSL